MKGMQIPLGLGLGQVASQGDGSNPSFDFGSSMPAGIVTTRGSLATQYDATTKLSRWCDHNLIPNSQDLTAASWTARNGLAVTANAAAAPDGTVTANLIEGMTGSGAKDLFDQITAPISGASASMSYYIKRVSTTGTLRLDHPGGGAGLMDVDLSLLSDDWERITEDHAAVVVGTFVPFVTAPASGLWWFAASGTLDFYLWGGQVNLGTTVLDYVATAGAAALAEPRRGTDAEGTGDVGLQQEPASTNDLTFSSDIPAGVVAGDWSMNNANSPLVIDATGLDGETSAMTLIDDSATGTGAVQVWQIMGLSTDLHTLSVFAKKDQLDWLAIRTRNFDAAANFDSWFDLNNGVEGTIGHDSSGMIAVAGHPGWYRCWVSITPASDATGTVFYNVCEGDGAFSTTELNGTSSILLYGPQAEEGPLTSYIPTGSSTETRLFETHVHTPSAGILDDDNGTMLVEYSVSGVVDTGDQRYVASMNDGTNAERHVMYNVLGGASVGALGSAGGGTVYNITTAKTIAAGTAYKMSVAWDTVADTATVSWQGSAVGSAAPGLGATGLDRINFGFYYLTPARALSGFIYSFKYWPTTKTPAEQDTLTT